MVHLACLRGNIGYWTYYSTVMKIKDIVKDKRIITVAESDELYTKSINKILQREVNPNRIKDIKDYILNNNERFFNSLIVAIHKGHPIWTDIDLAKRFEIDGDLIDENDLNFIESKFGILTLNGDEEIFALDGQHRLKGIIRGYETNKEIGEKEVSVIYVLHDHTKLDKTRRLFTVLNKYAEKPKGAELIIIDEDDAAAINARRLVNEHNILKKQGVLSDSKSGNLATTDKTSLTTLVTIYNINKILYDKNKNFYVKRPNDQTLNTLYNISKEFWDIYFEVFPEIVLFADGNLEVEINDKLIVRNDDTGGSLLLRPVGQELIAKAYKKFEATEIDDFKNKIRIIDFDLSSVNWKYIFWNGKMLGKEASLKNNLIYYLLGKYDSSAWITTNMRRIYGAINSQYDENSIRPVEII
ncbi:DNA sulfur modification protein DndB [Chryseobacterium sp. MYb264]|uniref:DNA sulfur modification protein DndB n=1 Tax=Chryseobacterium sp. MYb264 TaxID=2745153 RepID=UPI002E12FC52|nr:DNA sulfur modification protein DndB [Chryseobacterium sp. MYb264]